MDSLVSLASADSDARLSCWFELIRCSMVSLASADIQHVETHEVSVERAEEKSAVDNQDPVWSFNIIFTQKAVYVHCSRDVVATLVK